MSDTQGDAGPEMKHESLKHDQRIYWSEQSTAWAKWAAPLEKMAERFNEALLDVAGIGEGDAVLDLASGVGEPALTIARRVGARGRVAATDIVGAMLAVTERRAKEAALDDRLTARIADMEDLPFEDGAFDHVTCRFGIMFSPDADRALTEIRRVLKPGGRATLMVWGPEANTTMFETLAQVLDAQVGPDPAPRSLTPFRFGESDVLGGIMRRAGYADVTEKDLHFSPRPPAGKPFWRPQVEMSFGHRIANLDESGRNALDAALANAFAAFIDDENRYRLRAHIRVVSGIAP